MRPWQRAGWRFPLSVRSPSKPSRVPFPPLRTVPVWYMGTWPAWVSAVQLVDGKGDLLDIPSGDPRLPGARVHLGALGVLTSITLRVVPAFRLAEEIEQIPISEAIRNLEAIAHSAEYVKVWWIPRTQETQVYRYHRTDEPESTGRIQKRCAL